MEFDFQMIWWHKHVFLLIGLLSIESSTENKLLTTILPTNNFVYVFVKKTITDEKYITIPTKKQLILIVFLLFFT